MSLSVKPIVPATNIDTMRAVAVLRPGAVVDATVLRLLEGNLVRIAIAGIALDVKSEIALMAGQSLRFSVSQAAGGLRLSVIPSEISAQQQGAASATAQAAPKSIGQSSILTPTQMQAVTTATSQAATRQAGLAPLFANLEAGAAMMTLTPTLRQAVAQVLAARMPAYAAVSGDAFKQAIKNSGLFLEQKLASGGGGAGPDLKAMLLVLRHALVSAKIPNITSDAMSGTAPVTSTMTADDAGGVSLAAPLSVNVVPTPAATSAAPRTRVDAMIALLQHALSLPSKGSSSLAAPSPYPRGTDAPREQPPPPFRGAAPSAQPIVQPSIASDMSVHVIAQRLLADTEAALARQTLMQIASLPGTVEANPLRIDSAASRWLFEIPLALPQGTAVAQFEISRDGEGGDTPETGPRDERIWRARFSLDVEPAGPVHAIVSLTGSATSVRMWAERPVTAAKLQADAAILSRALRDAALEPGDITVAEGAPASPTMPAGHFWDRAS